MPTRPSYKTLADTVGNTPLVHIQRLEASALSAVGSVVLTGAGPGFCAGADLSEFKDLTPDQPARVEARACDGFVFNPPYMPQGFEILVEVVLPILRRRGLFRSEYEGPTLRHHFGLPRPPSPDA